MASTTNARAIVVFEVTQSKVCPQYGLYPYQRQVLQDLLAILNPLTDDILSRERRVIAHMPTGAGKTRVACHVACTLLNHAKSEDGIVVWLASTEELCSQAADDLETAWKHLGTREVFIHRFWGDASLDLANLADGFLVAGLSKMWAAATREPGLLTSISSSVAGVIFDEAHQAIARTYEFVTERLISQNPPLLGLTATPGRTLDIGDDDFLLADMFRGKKVSINPRGHASPVNYLIYQGYLAQPIFKEIDSASSDVQDRFDGLDYSSGILNSIGADEERNKLVVGATLEALKERRHRRVIVFCPSVESAKSASVVIRDAGFNAATIVADTRRDDRAAALGKFRSDDREPMALFNYGVLTAGVDAPSTSCVVVARPTKSLVMYSQMVGRAMRGPRSKGNRKCEIYTVVDSNLHAFRSVVAAFRNWERLWLQDNK